MDEKTKQLRSKSKTLKPILIIGKNGVNDEVIKKIKEYLVKNEIIKIKFLSSYIGDKDKKEVFLDLATKTKTKIIDQIGFTLVLKK